MHPEQNDRAAARTAVEFQPRPEDYPYGITWDQSRVATASISVDREDDHYVLKAKPYRVHEKTRIFIAADASRDIVKIKTQPGIGTARLRLVKYREK